MLPVSARNSMKAAETANCPHIRIVDVGEWWWERRVPGQRRTRKASAKTSDPAWKIMAIHAILAVVMAQRGLLVKYFLSTWIKPDHLISHTYGNYNLKLCYNIIIYHK